MREGSVDVESHSRDVAKQMSCGENVPHPRRRQAFTGPRVDNGGCETPHEIEHPIIED